MPTRHAATAATAANSNARTARAQPADSPQRARAAPRRADPAAEADAPLLPGWRRLQHITPRRPARPVRLDGQPAAPRGRRTWGITYRDPDLPPDHAPVTRSTGCAAQAAALEEAKRVNATIAERLLDIDRGRAQPRYLQLAHVDHHATSGREGKRIAEAVQQHTEGLTTPTSARRFHDNASAFARYCEQLGVHTLPQISEELLLGFTRTVILTPAERPAKGKARKYTTVDDMLRSVKAMLRRNLKYAPQLNSDVLLRGLPAFSVKAGGQAALVKALHEPTPAVREWIMASEPRRSVTAADVDEGGKVLGQDPLYRLLHAALRRDAERLRRALRRATHPRTCRQGTAAVRLVSVDIAALLLCGFRLSEYTEARCSAVQFGLRELMDRKARTDAVRVFGKGRRWRDVALTGYTVTGITLLRAVTQGRKPDDWLSEHTAAALGDWLRDKLPRLGAPRCKPKDMRSTGCNFAQRLHHIPIETRAARWGHTISVHSSYYLQATGSALQPAPTLEASMGLERLLPRVVRLVELRTQLFGVHQRAKKRHHPNHRTRPALP